MSRRVVITGMGAITPIGNSVEDFWNNAKEGKTGFCFNDRFDTEKYENKIVAEVKDFQIKDYIDVKVGKRMELFSQYAVAAAKQAMEDSAIDMTKEDPWAVGTCVGSGIGSLQIVEKEYEKLLRKGPRLVNPLMIPKLISNMASGNISIEFGLKGKNIDVVTACATGTNCIGEAMRTIQYGDADIMFAGGTEGSISEVGIAAFDAIHALSTSDDVNRCSIPFDKERNGFVMGEGAGVLVLEELEHAKARGAKIYAELVGYGCSADAYHITAPAPDGAGGAKAMEKAIKDAGIKPEEVTYINAHGTSTHMNDVTETLAIKSVFGNHAKDIKVNSTKSLVGHLLGAAGAVEAIACVKTIQEGCIHKTANYQVPDEECDLDYCVEPVKMNVDYALSNSLGFGGHNACIVIKKYK